MDKVKIESSKLGNNYFLSPEYWLSFSSADDLSSGLPLSKLVTLQKKGTTKISDDALILDTGNSDRGLFILPFPPGGRKTRRISSKKRVPEGSVLISRLRPYLQQVVYVPYGTCNMLGCSEILCSTEYYVITPKGNSSSIAFLVPWLLSNEVQGVFDQATTGGHHPRFSDELLLRLYVPDSVMESRDHISKSVEKLVIESLHAQIEMAKLVKDFSS